MQYFHLIWEKLMSATELLSGLLGAFSAGVWFWYDKKKSDQELRDFKKTMDDRFKALEDQLKILNDIVVTHKSVHITESKSRQIAEEVCGRMEKDVIATKDMVSNMMAQVSNLAASLQTHTAVQKALQEQNKHKE